MSKAGKRIENVKFECVDIIDIMGRVLDVRTEHYRSDFDIDKKILWSASAKEERQDRTYVWMCRKSGTWLLRERDVYIRDTRENNTFRYYLEQTSEPVILLIVEVTGYTAHTVIGNLYTVDYRKYYDHVMKKILPVESIVLNYEGGSKILEPGTAFDGYPDCRYGKFLSFEYQPHTDKKLREILWNERYRRDHFDSGDAEVYLAGLEHGRKQVVR